MSKEELGLQGQSPKPDYGSSGPSGAENSSPVSYTQNLGDYQLETLEVSDPEHPVVPQKVSADFGKIYKGNFSPKHRTLLISIGITLGVVLILTAVVALLVRRNSPEQSATGPVPVQDLDLQKSLTEAPAFTSETPALLVNGDIITSGNLKVLSGGFITTFKVDKPTKDQTITLPNANGVICLDSNNCGFADQGDLVALSNRLTTQLADIVIPPSGVSTLNDQDGDLTIQGIANQTTVTTDQEVITIGTAQNIAPTSSPTFSSLLLNSNLEVGGTVTLPLDCSSLVNGGSLTTNGSGQIICADDDGGASGAVTTTGGTTGTIPVFTDTQEIADSVITQSGSAITVTGSLSVTTAVNANSIQTGGTTRIDSSGNLTNIGTITASGLATVNGLRITSLASGFLEANGTGTVSVGSIDLGTDTVGNYVATITAGNGISGSSTYRRVEPRQYLLVH